MWLASLLIMVNIHARLGIKVKDCELYMRQNCDLSFSHDSTTDGVCALMEDEKGEVRICLFAYVFLLLEKLLQLLKPCLGTCLLF